MARQKQWDKYEAVILLDYYLQYLDGKLTREKAIRIVSAKLRKMAENQNICIDKIYRNINGIAFQMHSMESAYKGFTVMKPASRLFIEMVRLLKDDKEQYDKLLKEASEMAEVSPKDSREQYLNWLSQKISSAQLSEIYMQYETIDEFCIKMNILKRPLLQTTDITRVRTAQRAIEQNRKSHFWRKREMDRISSAMRYYVTYLEEHPVTENESTAAEPEFAKGTEWSGVRNKQDKDYADKYPIVYKKVYDSLKASKEIVGDRGVTVVAIYENIKKIAERETIKNILDSASWAFSDGGRYYFSEPETETKQLTSDIDVGVSDEDAANAILEKEGTNRLSFSEIADLSYTRPVYASYFGEEIQEISSWTQLYVNVFKKLYDDYGNRIPVNQSFSSDNGKKDFCTEEYFSIMAAPKEIVDGKYLETNLSATDLVRKMKRLLDICLVDEENLIIKYEKRVGGKSIEETKAKTRIRNTPAGEAFFRWLREEQGMAIPSCRSYVSAVNTAERYAMENNFNHCTLYTDNYQEARATADELFGDGTFIECNNQQHNRFRAAINKLLSYIGNDIAVQTPSADLAPFIEILIEKFPKGYRIGSTIELKRFKRYWEEFYGGKIDMNDSSIEKNIEHCGIIYEEKMYMPQKMLDEDIKSKLFFYINNSFQSGKSVIYYEALFKVFSDDFFGYCMYNAGMLHAYLAYTNDGSYFIGKNYISKDASVNVEPYDEIKECLIRQAAPMGYSEMFAALSHIPEQKVRTILAQNGEFVSNGRGEYFHISISAFSDDEMEDISEIIENTIAEKQFISGNELVDSIKKKYPYIIEQNASLSDIGLRNAIGYILRDKFSFNGNVISLDRQPLSMMEVFADFCRQRASFTLDELKLFKQEMGTVIYFDVVYENSLRISKNEFVSKAQASFKLEETDAVIDRFCNGDYIAIRKINQFGLFPDAGFSWNSFLLEHYVAMYSPNYKLLHSNYNEGACVGGIVKKASGIDTFDELVIDVLVQSDISLQKEIALQYLCDEGYIARRNYSGIEQLLIKAKELRNQKGL